MGPCPRAHVLLPGLYGSDQLWRPFLEAAPTGHTLFPVSYPDDVPTGFAELEEYVRSILPEEVSFIMIAESFSGPVAIRIAASPPANMLALVLCNTFAVAPYTSAWAAFPWKTLFRIPGPTMIIRRYMAGRSAPDSLVDQIRSLVLASDAAVLAARMRLVLRVDVRAHLSRIELPVLYLRGTGDRLLPGRSLQAICAQLPGLTISVVNAPHLTLQRAPAESWQAIERFCRRL
jgi:pimeloyl-ACP methyl ester carboxylesterase